MGIGASLPISNMQITGDCKMGPPGYLTDPTSRPRPLSPRAPLVAGPVPPGKADSHVGRRQPLAVCGSAISEKGQQMPMDGQNEMLTLPEHARDGDVQGYAQQEAQGPPTVTLSPWVGGVVLPSQRSAA